MWYMLLHDWLYSGFFSNRVPQIHTQDCMTPLDNQRPSFSLLHMRPHNDWCKYFYVVVLTFSFFKRYMEMHPGRDKKAHLSGTTCKYRWKDTRQVSCSGNRVRGRVLLFPFTSVTTVTPGLGFPIGCAEQCLSMVAHFNSVWNISTGHLWLLEMPITWFVFWACHSMTLFPLTLFFPTPLCW